MAESGLNKHELKRLKREERLKELEAQRINQTTNEKKSKTLKYILLGLGLVLVIGIIVYVSSSSNKPGLYDAFAQCLTEKGVTMYGAYWCPHCANQKKLFGSSFQYVHYVECDPGGKNAQLDLCAAKGVKGYPTWEINGTIESGEHPLQDLAEKSGCVL